MALSNATLDQYKAKFTKVHSQNAFKKSALELGSNDLVVCGKLSEDLVEAQKEFKLTLWVYKLQPTSQEDLTKRFYLNSEDYFSPPGCLIKESIESLTENKAVVKKIGNPNRILVDDADLLSKVLGIKPDAPKKEAIKPEPIVKTPEPAKKQSKTVQ
jgi:hypothetical protein